MTTLVPVDAEALIVAFLKAKMPGRTVATRVSVASNMVTVEQVGSVRRTPVHDHPIIVIQTWHADRIAASQMCREAFAHIWEMPDDPVWGERIRGVVSVGGPQAFPDPTADIPRWQASVELNLRPQPIGAPS